MAVRAFGQALLAGGYDIDGGLMFGGQSFTKTFRRKLGFSWFGGRAWLALTNFLFQEFYVRDYDWINGG
jgi:hypothetical protein